MDFNTWTVRDTAHPNLCTTGTLGPQGTLQMMSPPSVLGHEDINHETGMHMDRSGFWGSQ